MLNFICSLIHFIKIIDLQESIYQSLLTGNLSKAADLFLDNGKPVESLLLAITAGPQTLSRIQNKYLKVSKPTINKYYYLCIK